METNIALGLFVNSTQLLFRVMGAPPCHNSSLKEEQFNVNNIFSICLLMKTSQSTGRMFPPLWEGKKTQTIEKDEVISSRRDRSQRQSISPPRWKLLVAHIHLFTFAFFKRVSHLQLFRNFNFIFPRNSSEWLICMATSSLKRRYSTCQDPRLSSEKFDRSDVFWLGEIHPICTDNETAWQRHNDNYSVRQISCHCLIRQGYIFE